MDLSRRTLLTGTAVAAAGPALSGDDAPPAVLVSTWDFGVPANAAAHAVRQAGGSALDMVEAGARVAEADVTNASVGIGGFPDREGHVTLDAVIMNGRGDMGSVCALEDIVHAVSVARRVMEATPHVILVGEGARTFALEQGFETTPLLTPEAEAAWRRWLDTANYAPLSQQRECRLARRGLRPRHHRHTGHGPAGPYGRRLHHLGHGLQDEGPRRRQSHSRGRPVGR